MSAAPTDHGARTQLDRLVLGGLGGWAIMAWVGGLGYAVVAGTGRLLRRRRPTPRRAGQEAVMSAVSPCAPFLPEPVSRCGGRSPMAW
jgi:hypothetical protein